MKCFQSHKGKKAGPPEGGRIVFVAFLLLVLNMSSTAQDPTLNPDQTVNTATGEMGFALPLGTVKGINGHDFPVNLGYKAGIPIMQEAGPAGLGFSVDAGSIVRRPIFVPDNNVSTVTPSGGLNNSQCDVTGWKSFLLGALSVLGYILAALSIITMIIPGGQGFGAFLLYASSTVLTAAQMVVSQTTFTPNDYRAGGTQTPSYDYTLNNGAGFFKNGEQFDLPDLYFVSTPYVNGQLVWVGNRQNGHFVLQSTGGSIDAQKSTTKVTYDVNREVFRIQLADGTVLLFEETDNRLPSSFSMGNTHESDKDCSYSSYMYSSDAIADVWHLTKVLFPDFKGNETDPETGGSGSWIVFKYIAWSGVKLFPFIPNVWAPVWQASERDIMEDCKLDTWQRLLQRIVTQNQNADIYYNYGDRLDCFRVTPNQTYDQQGFPPY